MDNIMIIEVKKLPEYTMFAGDDVYMAHAMLNGLEYSKYYKTKEDLDIAIFKKDAEHAFLRKNG